MSGEAFFNWKIPQERKEKARKEADAYDARELEHAHAMENELTGERLVEIAKQEKKEALARRVVEVGKHIQQQIATRASPSPILDDISELRDALTVLEAETLQAPHRKSSAPGVKAK